MTLFAILMIAALAWAWIAVVVAVVVGRSLRRRQPAVAVVPVERQLSRSSR